MYGKATIGRFLLEREVKPQNKGACIIRLVMHGEVCI